MSSFSLLIFFSRLCSFVSFLAAFDSSWALVGKCAFFPKYYYFHCILEDLQSYKRNQLTNPDIKPSLHRKIWGICYILIYFTPFERRTPTSASWPSELGRGPPLWLDLVQLQNLTLASGWPYALEQHMYIIQTHNLKYKTSKTKCKIDKMHFNQP